MRPYILEDRLAEHPDKRYLTPNQRRRSSKIQTQVLTDYLKGDSMWALHKKYGVEYNLIKYHIKRYERRPRGPHEESV
jgi:hypothetical protein